MPIVGDVLVERYRIDGVLGAGGMASVYRATDLRLDRQVALKVLLPNLARDPGIAGRFDREARMLAAVAHPSVAAIFDVEPGDPATGREPFYVMELCDGGSLADRIEAVGAIDPTELVPVIAAIADGLAALHAAGVIHRDVKPGNILFAGGSPTEGGRPKLADFGIAKADATPEATTLTAPGTMVGTLPYLAPELLVGGPPTVASDVYALGATTFHGLTGRLPKPFDSLGQFVDARSAPAPTVSSVMPSLGTGFDGPVAAALAIEPAARPDALAFAGVLRTALEGLGASNGSPSSASGSSASEAPTEVLPVPPAPVMAPPPTPVVAPPPSPAPPPPAPVASVARPRTARRGASTGIVLAVAIVLLLLIVATLALLAAGSPPPPGPAAGSASPGPTSGASSTPAATAAPDPAAPAMAALDRVYAAIDQARGGKDGLSGGEAHDLQQLADQVAAALRADDFASARTAAASLADRADQVSQKIDPAKREALLGAIHDLQAAIPQG